MDLFLQQQTCLVALGAPNTLKTAFNPVYKVWWDKD